MNCALWLLRAGAQHGTRPAIAVGRTVIRDYRTLARRAAGLATALRGDLGLDEGDRVAIVAENHPAYLEALFAAWWAGLIAVPLDARLHPSEVQWITANAQVGASFLSASCADTRAESDSMGRAVVFDTPDYERLAASPPAELCPQQPDAGAWLFYTSGTTGRPKGALLTHRNIAVMSLAHLCDVDPTGPGDVLIHSAPLSHASGLLSVPHLLRLGLNVIPESGSFEADEVLDLIHHWRQASLFAAPTMVRRLIDHSGDIDHRAIRSIVWGGAPMHVPDVIRALDRLGPCLAQVYGQGETPMTITSLSKNAIANRDEAGWEERLGSAGTARSVVEVRVADEHDQSVPPGELGEVLVRGDTVMSGYWQNPKATASALRGGWLHTGDIGVMDRQGNLTLRDRSKDLIISGGLNVYPREVEEVLAAVDGVREVSVIGRPHPEWGEVVVAYIAGSAQPEVLERACLEHIARFKRPRAYVYLDALPKSNVGKVLKSKLRELDATGQHQEAPNPA